MDYAIFRTGGKQYRVTTRDVIDVDKLPVDAGVYVEMTDVLAISRDGDLRVGRPLVAGARVVAEVEAQTRDRKIIVFKYKRKVRYRRKRGHRQPYTRLAIRELLLEGEEAGVVAEAPEAAVAVLDVDEDTALMEEPEAEEPETDEPEADEPDVEEADAEEAQEEATDELDVEVEDETEEAGSDDESPDEEGAR
jgi:large subunit ribosomal protein L21